jgi:hypothetical protein
VFGAQPAALGTSAARALDRARDDGSTVGAREPRVDLGRRPRTAIARREPAGSVGRDVDPHI